MADTACLADSAAPAAQAAGDAVSLAELLAAREARQARQNEWLAQHKTPLISFTPIAPGAVKNNALTRAAFARGAAAIAAELCAHNWPLIEKQEWLLPTGAEAFFAVNAPAAALKQAMTALEDDTPIGRLWDIDVLDTSGKILSRADFGLSPRRCLICERPAAECGRKQSHSIAELQAKMGAILCL